MDKLFRVWDNDYQCMNYKVWIDPEGIPVTFDDRNTKIEHNKKDLMKYIGINDIHGNKIFEEDIIQGVKSLKRFTVIKAHLHLGFNTEKYKIVGNTFEELEKKE